MIERFQGPTGERLVVEALCSQTMLSQEGAAALDLARKAELRELAPGEVLIAQGGTDNDIYFILAGSVRVIIHGREIAIRDAGMHIGEMALVDPSATRSATVAATEVTVVAKVAEPNFSEIADRYPRLWRVLARELGLRLRQRSKFVQPPNDRPSVFVGSSGEGLPFAEALCAALASPELETRLWKDGIFGPSRYPMEDLEKQLGMSDFAVLVATADDMVTSRGTASFAPRDNVIFELGLFMGALTRGRTFMVVPRGVDLKIPTDLVGLTLIRYDATAPTTARDASEQIRAIVVREGPR